MTSDQLTITYVGGPTALLEFGGIRLVTDPTFDAAGGEYRTGAVTLRKLTGPGRSPEDLGSIDYVLLSHDHHFDNLDHAGRALLPAVKKVITTSEGADRLGGNSVGLKDWESIDVAAPYARVLRIIATPARHGPEGINRGAVNGFVFFFTDSPERAIYVSGDTVWYPGVAEVAGRFPVECAILHLGAAMVPAVGNFHLTMTAAEAVEAAGYFAAATIVPVHFEDWEHFSEGKEQIARAFEKANLRGRLRWLERGRPTHIDLPAVADKSYSR